jgi:predicted ATPase/DNA-binding CsgD family transcriptional regulator
MPDNAPRPSDGAKKGDGRGSLVTFPGKRLGAIPSTKNNLPFQLTSLVGREREINEVKGLLAGNRLLTLTGPGGCGKTRLALAVASELAEGFEEGAWLVELAPLADPELVPQAVASILDVREVPGRPLVETLSDYLGSKKMLLILDNCEHLVEACAELAAELLRACPDLRVLATSREALGIGGEVSWPVPPLSLPDPRRLPTVGSLPGYEAARLFIERASAVTPNFSLTGRNATAVARVCWRLDGIPLAIELAAARVKVLSVEQIAGRLEGSFGLLSGGSRTAMPQHRTLRATMDWSHELLSEEERVLFRRLSVFAGGFSLKAAEVVCDGTEIEREGVLDLLAHLIDKSLVSVVGQQGGETRYRLLETVRQYGREKLRGSGEEDRIRRLHVQHYLALAEHAEPQLKGARQATWFERLDIEHGNLRAALTWSLDPKDPNPQDRANLGLRLAAALALFWNIHGLSEGSQWLETALEKSSTESIVRAKALNGVGWLMLYRGEHERAVARLEEALILSKKLGDKSSVAVSLAHLGRTVVHQGDAGRIQALRLEAEEMRQGSLDPRATAELLFFLGAVARHEKDYERSVGLCEESLELFRELEDTRGISRCINGLGTVALEYGDQERAAALLEEALWLLWGLKEKTGISFSLLGLAGVASSWGEPTRAARLWAAAEVLREDIGLALGHYERSRYGYEGRLAAARSQLEETAWEAAWAEGRAMSLEQAVEYALEPSPTTQQEEPAAPPTTYPARLSAREVEVLRLVAEGLTNAQVAEKLFISPRTVNAHLNSIYGKLGFNSRVEATRFAVDQDLLS